MSPTNLTANKIFIFLFFLAIPFTGFAQNKNKLEKEKQESLKKIKETEKIIVETKTQKQATMGQLTAISQQIEARQALINSISREIKLLDDEITETENIINALEGDLTNLKEEYAAMIYEAAKMDNSIYKLAFIFSAESVNQMVMRVKYFQQYSDARENQLEQIEKLKATLSQQKTGLNKKRSEKNNLLHSQTIETTNLNSLKKEKNEVVKELSKKETELKAELEETKKSIKQLENKIREIIEEERKKAIAAAALAEKNKKNATTKNSAHEGKDLLNNFGGNQNRLPWPVTSGTVVRKYGRQKHPVLGIEENNLGVGIQTLKGEQVRAVFSGKVISVTEIPGMNKIVMIQHGEFFTVYARLKKVYVKKDQEVTAKEIIGEVYTNKEEVSQVEFQIWQGNNHLDPELWLSKK
jgi:murein hydrolase activator